MDATTELLPASAVREWANRISPQQAQEERFQKAFSAFDKALVATIEYLKKLREGGPENESEESELSSLWREASEKVRPLDADLANRCYVKGISWLDPVRVDGDSSPIEISIQSMQDALLDLNRRGPRFSETELPTWLAKVGVVFLAFTVLSLFYLIVGPGVAENTRIIFDVWVALCIAASFAFIGGYAYAKGDLPIPGIGTPIQFSTGGGIAVFVVAFLMLLAAYH